MSIKKSKKATMSTRRRLFYSASSLSALQVVEIIISFLLMPVMIAQLGSQQYGTWILIYTISFYLGFLNVGLASSVQRYLSIAVGNNNHDEFNQVASSSFYIFILLALALVPVILLISHFSVLFTDSESAGKFSAVILIIGLKVILLMPGITFMAVLVASIRQDLQGLVEILTVVLRAIGMLFVLKTSPDIVSLAWVVLTIETLGRGGIVYFAYKVCPYLSVKQQGFSVPVARSMVSFSIQAVVVWLGTRVRDSAHNFIISKSLGVSSIVIISVPFMLIMYAHQFVSLLISPLTPLLTHHYSAKKHDDFRRIFAVKCDIALAISAIILLQVIFLGNDFIAIWLNGLIETPGQVFFALGLFMFIISSQRPLYNYLTIANQQGKLILLTYVEALIVVASEIIFIEYSLEAMIWGLVIPSLFMRGLVLPLLCYQSMQSRSLQPGYLMFRPVLIIVATGLLNNFLLLDGLLLVQTWWQLVGFGMLIFLIALVLSYVVIHPVTRAYIRDVYKQKLSRTSQRNDQ